MASSNKVAVPQISLPTGGGALNGLGDTLQAGAFSGSANLSIPINISIARDIQTELVLQYSSSGGNGPFGLGFTVSTPSISRKTEQGIPRYKNSDKFILSDSDDLVPKLVENGDGQWVEDKREVIQDDVTWIVVEYFSQLEGLFAKIEQYSNPQTGESYWQLTSKDNVTSVYGRSDDARIFDPNNRTRIFQWLIEQTLDSKGNKTIYTYKRENDENVPAEIYEINRSNTANRYIQSIKYGNYPVANGEEFAFEVVFDYGEYDLSNPDAPPGSWSVRSDPFSTYNAGFEIRTYRLCQGILMYHHFTDEHDDSRFLVRATRLGYEQTPGIALLTSVQEAGYRKTESGVYESRDIPPLEFFYSTFNPESQEFKPITVNDNASVPGFISASQYLLVDLYGEGIPGFLYSNDTTTLYWSPKGRGRYGYPEEPVEFPIEKDLSEAEYTLMDLDSNGRLDLVVSVPPRAGYYGCRQDTTWNPYEDFESFPLELANPARLLVDLDGNGLTDILIPEAENPRFYPSRGLSGYGPAQPLQSHDPAAVVNNNLGKEFFVFASIFGDGLSHPVRVRNGIVEAWPNLGYGKFGAKVLFGNAPHFNGSINEKNLFFADIDGSGIDDLIYADSENILVYRNQSGNSFSAPISITLPQPYTETDQISFADVLGIGTSALVLTQTDPQVTHSYYNFIGDHKPYLIVRTENNIGARTAIKYASSTKFYLEDKLAGTPWITSLPFPVQVVEQMEAIDLVSGLKVVSSYKYHDGYFDPVQRQFRGFGFVEHWDTQIFEEYAQPGLLEATPFEAGDPELHVPPVYTKTWYHTGAYIESGLLSKQYQKEYYQKDPLAYDLPDSSFERIIEESGSATVRQAYSALKGQQIREEVYALDTISLLSDNPYTVTESNFFVRMLQPSVDIQQAVFYVYERESLTYDYERHPEDPRINHSFTLEVDEFGNVVQSCQVVYPRRQPVATIESDNPAHNIFPEQLKLRVVAHLNRFRNVTDEFYLIGVPYENKVFDISGVEIAQGLYLTFEEVKLQVEEALTRQIPFNEKPQPGELEARMLTWQKSFYWNEAMTAPLGLGEVTARALPHHSQDVAFPPGLITDVFGSKVTDQMLYEQGGYFYEEGYWWNPGLIGYYYPADCFYLPSKTEALYFPWEDQRLFGVRTLIEYDKYCLLPVTISQYVSPDDYNVVHALIDYNTLNPKEVRNANDNILQALFDPMGFVIATSMFGEVEGVREGDGNLADYVRRTDPTFDKVLDDKPFYLQQATTYFYYDPYSWMEGHGPIYSIQLARQTFVSDLQPGEETLINVLINYSDGYGRDIEKKMEADCSQAVIAGEDGQLKRFAADCDQQSEGEQSESAICWIVSGKTVYNNKGMPTEQYMPYFSSSPHYEAQSKSSLVDLVPPPTVIRYDPLLRVIRIDTPKGFFSKVVFTPWVEYQYDEDDTVKDSRYYIEHIDDPNLNPDERNALEKAALFFDTPQEMILDNMGRTFQSVAINQEVTPEGLLPVYLTTHYTLDIQGNRVAITDPRLARHATPTPNLTQVFDMTGDVLSSNSVDSGLRLMLNNIIGNPIQGWDGRGFNIEMRYDLLQRVDEIEVHGDEQPQTADRIVEKIIYGESQPDSKSKNLRGEIFQYYDQAGILHFEPYNIQNHPLQTRRQLVADYKLDVSWNDPPSVALDPEIYPTEFAYNALGSITSLITPDGSNYKPLYGLPGWMKQITVDFLDNSSKTFVTELLHDATGQRKRITFGNNAVTNLIHEFTTKRLIEIATSPSSEVAEPTLQHVNYTYDPVGNVTRLRDYTHQTVFCDQQTVGDLCDYTCDAIYRLIEATGKQHPGITLDTHVTGFKQTLYLPLCQPQTENEFIKLQSYRETYSYDDSNNLTDIEHFAPETELAWSRKIDIAPDSNRAYPQDSPDTAYDANGNMLALANLKPIKWNYRNMMAQVDNVASPESSWCRNYSNYDYAGVRIRNVVEYYDAAGNLTGTERTLHIGTLVLKRKSSAQPDGEITTLDLQSLHVMDGEACVAIANKWLEGGPQGAGSNGAREFRYQLNNSLNSSVVEVDEQATAISYEDFFPFGGSSVIAGNSPAQVEPKDFRYSGKEADDSTGLYYYGARYYASWLGRWLNPDPAGMIDGVNLYMFVGDNPMSYFDRDGYARIRLVSWNMRGSTKGVKRKARRLGRIIRKHGVDAIVLQEASSDIRLLKKYLQRYLTNKKVAFRLRYRHMGSKPLPGGIMTTPTGGTPRSITPQGIQDYYAIFYNINTIKKMTLQGYPDYPNDANIQQEYSTTPLPARQDFATNLGYRRPLEIDVKLSSNQPGVNAGNRDAKLYTWHAPEGGNKMLALPAISTFNSSSHLNGQAAQRIILAGDLNARINSVRNTMTNFAAPQSVTSGNWDHIVGHNVNVASDPALNATLTQVSAENLSDHPLVGADITWV
jgi:RHS repeat-associated protein